MSVEFDWSDGALNIPIPEQPATCVYTNPRGMIVVRQAGQYHQDEDAWLIIAPQNVPALVAALLQEADVGDGVENSSTDSTAAARQRRYRQRRRHRDVTPPTVTTRDADRNAVTLQPQAAQVD